MRDLSLAIPAGFGKRKSRTLDFGSRLNWALLAASIILGLSYLFMVNNLATKGYDIKKLEKALGELSDYQKTLQLQTSELQSINRIQAEATELNFVPAANVTYLKDPDFALK